MSRIRLLVISMLGEVPVQLLFMTKPFRIMGLALHEILFCGLLVFYLVSGSDQKMTPVFEAFYFLLLGGFLLLLGLRAREQWHQMENKTLFFGLLAAWLALFHFLGNSTFGYMVTPSLLSWMYSVYCGPTEAGDDTHGMLIPFVVLALFWWKRKELLAQPLRMWSPGLMLVAASLLLHVVGYLVQQPRVSIVALFAGIYGLMGLVWGTGWLRASFFPFFLFVFCVPLGTLTESVTFPLRLLVTKIVAFVGQHLLAIDIVNQGTRLFKMPWQYEYEVAAACSGIRSLIAIMAIAIIYAFTSFRHNWKRVFLIISAVPLAIIGNTFRMLAIVIAAELRGQQAGIAVHDSAFWSLLPYVPAIIGLILIGRWLENWMPGANHPTPPMQERRTL